MKFLGTPWSGFCGTILGALLGTFVFLCLFALWVGTPITDSLLSAHGVFVRNERTALTPQEEYQIVQLLRAGTLLTGDGLLANIQAFYQNLINALVGSFVVFGIISFIAVRSHTTAQVDELVTTRIEHGLSKLFDSKSFHDSIAEKIERKLELALEGIDNSLQELGDLASEIREKTRNIAASDEQENSVLTPHASPAKRPTSTRRRSSTEPRE